MHIWCIVDHIIYLFNLLCIILDDVVPEYKQPYQDEVGLQPSLHDLRRVVVALKIRPTVRQELIEHNVSYVFIFIH